MYLGTEVKNTDILTFYLLVTRLCIVKETLVSMVYTKIFQRCKSKIKLITLDMAAPITNGRLAGTLNLIQSLHLAIL